jgi:hypothetical protein
MKKSTSAIRQKQRYALDTILKGLLQDGRIFAQELRNAWKSIVPYLNRKRLIYFLEKNSVLLAKKTLEVIANFNKKLAKGVPTHFIAA